MNICPCCGAKTDADLLTTACEACGALRVGPPLARPEKELPSYLSAVAVGASSVLLVVIFLINTLTAFLAQKPAPAFEFWNIVTAGEMAAWRLKWFALPLSLLIVWAGVRVSARIVREPMRFTGLRLAELGFKLSVVLAVGLTVLIGLTIPERLRQRERGLEAAKNVEGYEAIKVLYEYRARFNSYPATAEDLRKLPDPDGSVARLIDSMRSEAYEPQSAIAALPPAAAAKTSTPRVRANVPIRPVALRTAVGGDVAGEALSFTNYKLRLPGKDKLLGTEDDLMIRDGVIIPAPPLPQNSSRTNAVAPTASGTQKP
ncbi:MAG TPA: hypothetical protein VGW12_08745 [Pyrinomonadaceae bacterium]|nr:hypothetical protein [Pyrinomonadaceae bacterium]